jgi:two-component system, NarL family, nitrate/nitrite response regulator NarL
MDTQANPITIVVADEDASSRRELLRALSYDPGSCVTHEALDSVHALTLTHRLKPHIVLLDLTLARRFEIQDINGSPACRVRTRMIITIATLDGQQIIEALQIGASGIVLKSSSPQALLHSIRSTLADHLWLERPLAATLAETVRGLSMHRNRTAGSGEYGLTPRELDIIARIAGGRTNREVSRDCAMSERTVKHHLTNIFDKVGVSTRLELAVFALDHQLVHKNRPSDGLAIS